MKYKFKISKRLTDHLINAILIFASVFLAFWMNEIRIEQKEAELTEEAKTAILIEFKINLLILERWTPYHKEIFEKGEEQILSNIDTISKFNFGLIPGLTKGIQREILTNNGWSLVDDQQINFELKTRLLINQIYEQQRYVTRATSKITDDFMNQRELLDESKVKENYIMFYSLIGELWGQEKAMIQRLKEAINELEK